MSNSGTANRKHIVLTILIFVSIFFLRCSESSSEGIKSFWVIDFNYSNYSTNSSAWYEITTEKKYESGNIIIYVDEQAVNVTESSIITLGDQFNNNIYQGVTQNFAQSIDVDGNGKLTLVVLDIRDDFASTGAYTGGYFYGFDFYSQTSIDSYNSTYGTVIKTNSGDIIYIDINPQDITSEDSWRTAAHEFQHLVNLSNVFALSKGSVTDTWIDEGLAEAANHMSYGEVTPRIIYYNSDSYNYIRDGHPLFLWDTSSSTKTLINYSLSYLFFQYMRSQSSSGNGIFKKIMQSPYGDYRAIQDAMSNDTNLVDSSWGSSAAERFQRLLLRWYATNAGVSDAGKYKYDSGILTGITPHIYTPSGSVLIKSGGGVVKSVNADFSPSGTDFIYLSVTGAGSSEDFTGATYSCAGACKFIAVYSAYNTGTHTGETSTMPILNPDFLLSNKSAEIQPLSSINQGINKAHKIDFVIPANGFNDFLKMK